jgi:two-component system sensor histidine kinase KdpD
MHPDAPNPETSTDPRTRGSSQPASVRDYLLMSLIVLACTGLAALMHGRFEPSNLIMVYLLGVMWVAVALGRGPAVVAAILSVAAFDFFFVPPHLTFAVADSQYLFTVFVMLAAAMLIGTLAARLRAQVHAARALARERVRLAKEAEAARLQGETERMRSALLSSVSHDLRTPLAVITGATSTLLEQEGVLDEEERRDLLRTAADEAGRLNRLVGNLLAMTRLEAGAVEVRREWHSLEDLIGAALHRLEPFADGRAFTVHVPDDLPLVPVDDVLIEQVLFNLAENALKHGGSPAPIAIGARHSGSDVEVSVADRGPGLPPGAGERLFEKFYRGESARRSEGAGLGLAICRGIVEAHGGVIRAAEEPGGGARFTFTLPLGAGPPQLEAEPQEVRHGLDS